MLELKAEPAALDDTRLEPVPFTALAGWSEDDHGAAFSVFRRSCKTIVDDEPALRPASAAKPDLRAVCRAALAEAVPDGPAARRFFEARFEPFHIVPGTGRGFLTGYFEPEYDGSLVPTSEFTT
ncbi:MAG TPA: lytic murein transglycosylase, partial [Beijerinckiaceae bacterium]|nr:lytic murein transglycosylase [Beijerinckiaceae bacterium]